MSKLDHDLLVLRVSKFAELREVLDLTVLPEPRVFWSDPAVWSDSRRLNARDSWTALNDATHVRQMPGIVIC